MTLATSRKGHSQVSMEGTPSGSWAERSMLATNPRATNTPTITKWPPQPTRGRTHRRATLQPRPAQGRRRATGINPFEASTPMNKKTRRRRTPRAHAARTRRLFRRGALARSDRARRQHATARRSQRFDRPLPLCRGDGAGGARSDPVELGALVAQAEARLPSRQGRPTPHPPGARACADAALQAACAAAARCGQQCASSAQAAARSAAAAAAANDAAAAAQAASAQ